MKLSWFRRSKITVEVLDDEILVTMPGTSFSIVYEKTKDNQLIASSFSGRNNQDEKPKVSFPRFLALAWTAANEQAKELGWIVCRGTRGDDGRRRSRIDHLTRLRTHPRTKRADDRRGRREDC